MKLTLEEMREVARRLPVGYYLGMKVPVFVEDGQRAHCDVVKGDIHIGLGLLQQAADNIDASDAAKWDREKLLRCLLYHEIGHLLLTPQDLLNPYCGIRISNTKGTAYNKSINRELVNIFEDERLECVLSKFFMGVDFRGFCKLVNKGAGKSKSITSKFYGAVRLRNKPSVSAAVDEAIRELSGYNATEGWGDSVYRGLPRYDVELEKLVHKILEDEQEENEKTQGGKSGSGQQQPKDRKPDGGEREDGSQSEGEDGPEGEDESDKEDKQEQNGESEGGSKDESEDEDESDGKPESGPQGEQEERKDGSSEGESENEEGSNSNILTGRIPEDYLQKLAKSVFVVPNKDTEKALGRFAMRLSKKKGNQAAGCWSALHGKIDTRRDATDKDRIFRRRSDVGERLNEAVNLVLWVDCSGSFSASEPTLNEILSATARAVGMSGGKLEVQVVKMTIFAQVASQTDWQINACGGNAITSSYLDSWKRTRAKGRRNIDIVVFDGRCKHTQDASKLEAGPLAGKYIEELIWNHPGCYVVSDTTNRPYFDQLMKKAHITYLNSGYAERLKTEVIKILDRIL